MGRNCFKKILLVFICIIIVCIFLNYYLAPYNIVEQDNDSELGKYVTYNPNFQENFSSDVVFLEITNSEVIWECIEKYSARRTFSIVDTGFSWIDVQFQFFIIDEKQGSKLITLGSNECCYITFDEQKLFHIIINGEEMREELFQIIIKV